MAAPDYMKLNVAHIMADSTTVDTLEFGAYMRILLAMWQDHGVLTLRQMERAAHVSRRQWPAIWRSLSHFFAVDEEGRYTQKRLAEELIKARSTSQSRRDAARVRWDAPSANADANGYAKASQTNALFDELLGTKRADLNAEKSNEDNTATHANGDIYHIEDKNPSKRRTFSPIAKRYGNLVWKAVPPAAQEKAGSNQRTIAAIQDHVIAAGEDVDVMLTAVRTYYADQTRRRAEAKFIKLPHNLISEGTWREWVGVEGPSAPPMAAPQDPTAPRDVICDGRRYTSPPGRTLDQIGSMADPGPRRQLRWLDDWRRDKHLWKRHEWGPPPNEPDTRIWPSVAEQHQDVP